MIPFLLIGGGAYLIFESLGTNRSSFDPLDYGFPTKGYRGYRKGKSYLASGGKVSNPYEDFLLANGFDKAYQVKKDGFTEYRKGKWFAQINTRTKEINAGKYIKDYSYADIKKYGGIRENSPFYSSDRYTNSLSKFKKFLDDYYALDEVKMAKGGEIKSYKDFKAKLLDLANQESDRNAFAEKVKSDLKKYIPLYFSNSRRDILNVTDNQYRLYMTKPGQYAKELNSITWESVYDKLKGKMEKGGETSLIGKKIRLIKMENDPRPVEPGTMGTIKHVGGGVYNVDWDNGRSLGVVEGEDEFEIIN